MALCTAICDACGYHNKKYSISKHISEVHGKRQPLVCDVCSASSFKRRSHLVQHITRHQQMRPFKCDYCVARFFNKFDLKAHTAKRHVVSRITSFWCDECEQGFEAKDYIVGHVNAVHRNMKPFNCSVCGAGFRTKSHLNIHLKAVHQRERVQCDACEAKIFYYAMGKHWVIAHFKQRRFECPKCKATFYERVQLRVHTENVHGSDVFVCDSCLKLCTSRSYLMNHIRYAHMPAKHEFECSVCGETLKTKEILKKHSSRHKEKGIKCDECGKDFGRKDALMSHVLLRHMRLRSFQCNLCEASFCSQQVLKNHVKTVHNRIKLFVCDACSKAFSTKNHLHTHCRGTGVHNDLDVL